MGYWVVDVALWLVVVVSLLLAAIYTVRVWRKRSDPLRWLLLGVLGSLAMTNAPVLAEHEDRAWPWGVHLLLLLVALGSMGGAAWPLLRDTWNEACLWFTVARDSWRLVKARRQGRM